MVHEQYGGSGQRCNACNIEYDFLDRAPKLLNCGHCFCIQCLHTMKKEDFIQCHHCGYRTPAPKTLAWLPTFTDALPKWQDSDTASKPSSGISKMQIPPTVLWHYTSETAHDDRNDAIKGTSAAAAKGNPLRVVTGLSWATPGPRRAEENNNDVGASGTNKGFSSAAEDQVCREFEMSVYPSNAGVPNSIKLLWSDVSTNVKGTNEVFNEPTNKECSSQASYFSNHRNEEVRFGPFNDPQPASLSQVNQMTEELNDLVEKLAIATNSINKEDGWIFSSYFEEERRNILRNMLDLQKEETLIRPLRLVRNSHQPCKSQMLNGQVPRFGTDAIDEIETFLAKVQSLGSKVSHDSSIFRLCVILMYQRYKTFLRNIEDAKSQQENGKAHAIAINHVSNLNPSRSNRDYASHIRIRDSNLQTASDIESAQTTATAHAIVARTRNMSFLRDQNFLDNTESSEVDIIDINRETSMGDVTFDIQPFKIRWNDLANIYFLDFDINGVAAGRVIVEIFPSITPLMSANFAVLCSGTSKTSYKGCRVFQCWNGQSIITGDTENNTGTGGKSILNDEFFVPDQKSLPAERGTIGMRRLARSPKTEKGKVSSQFRILLNRQPKITGLFGYIVSGIEVVDNISRLGDGNGNPRKRAIISNCGKLDI